MEYQSSAEVEVHEADRTMMTKILFPFGLANIPYSQFLAALSYFGEAPSESSVCFCTFRSLNR